MEKILFKLRLCLKKFKKAVSVFACMSLLVSSVFVPETAYASAAEENSAVFRVPASMGRIVAEKYFGGDEIIVNIQDLHCHGETQKNICKILGFLDEKYGLDGVFLEGAAGEIDTGLLSELASTEIGKNTVEKLCESGYLGGAEYYAALNKKDKFIKGIEDKSLYDRNIALLNKIMTVKPEVSEICDSLISEMRTVKRDYGNKETRKLDSLISKFGKNKIKSEKYYPALIKTASSLGLDTDDYPAIKAYSESLKKSKSINSEKTRLQFGVFFSELKNKIPYKEYTRLSQKSASFANIEDISRELAQYDAKYSICEKAGLSHLKNFLNYLQFSDKVNPVELIREERNIKEDLYAGIGKTKYEREVLFLFDFIPSVQGYFTADITAEDLEFFKNNFARFKRIWCSYFAQNTAEKLSPYADMLSEYHNNNVKRDAVFADFLLKNGRRPDFSKTSAKKNIKVVITGGFHSGGLEKIFNDNKISYVTIMPKVTTGIEEARGIYADTIKSYSSIAASAINIKPFMSERINESLPKVISGAFSAFSNISFADNDAKKAQLYEFVQKEFINKRSGDDIVVSEWEIDAFEDGKMTVSVVYKNKAGGNEIPAKYEFSGNKFRTLSGESGGEIRGRGKRLLSIFDGFFKNANTPFYKFYTVIAAPVIEEAVFRFLPFVLAGAFFSNPVSFVPAAVTVAAGVFLFTFLHNIKNKSANVNFYYSDPRMKYIFFSSIFLTAAFLITAASAAPFAAYGVSVLAHILNNAFVLSGRLKGFVLNAAEKAPKEAALENYGDMIEDLEYLINGKTYGNYSDIWKVPDELKARFNAVVDKLREADAMPVDEKYAAAAQRINELYKLLLTEELKAGNSYYGVFLADMRKALEKAGKYVRYEETGETVYDEISAIVFDILSGELGNAIRELKDRDEKSNAVLRDAESKMDSLTEDMSSEQKKAVVRGVLGQLAPFIEKYNKDFSRPTGDVNIKFMQLSLYFEDGSEAEDSLFSRFLKSFDERWKSNEEYKNASPEHRNDNNISNWEAGLRTRMVGFFSLMYPFSTKYAFKIIRSLYRYKYINNEKIPRGAEELILSRYVETKKYFLSIARDGVDAELADGLSETVEKLKKINFSGAGDEKQRKESVKELEFLTDKINDTTVILVERQVLILLTLALKFVRENDAQWAVLADAVAPVLKSWISKRKEIITEDIIKRLQEIGEAVNVEEDGFMNSFVPLTALIIADSHRESKTNKQVRKTLYETARKLHEKSVEKESAELNRKAFEVLETVAVNAPGSAEIMSDMFMDFGVNADTLNLCIDSCRKAQIREFVFSFPENDEKIVYSEDTAELIMRAVDIADLSGIIQNACGSGAQNGKKLAGALIDGLYSLAQDGSADMPARIRAAGLLGRAAQKAQTEFAEKLDTLRINRLFHSLEMLSEVAAPYVYVGKPKTGRGLFAEKDYMPVFNYTRILKHIPEKMLSEWKIFFKNPVFLDVKGVTDKNNKKIKAIAEEFEKLQEVLKFNFLALEAASKLTAKSPVRDFENIMFNISKMAESLSKINEGHGQAGMRAIEKIMDELRSGDGLNEQFIKRQNTIGKWDEDKIDQIDGINTLINAIHQTSISDFKKQIANLQKMNDEDVRTVTASGYNKDEASRENVKIVGYDLSGEKYINRDVKNFFIKLAEGNVSIDNFIFKEALVVWSTRLFAHSVDMFFNFGENDRGMTVYYHEGGRSMGNSARVRYFEKVLEKLGFQVEADSRTDRNLPGTCGLKAVLNKNAGLNDSMDLVGIAGKTIMLFKHSTNLDMQLEDEVFNKYAHDFSEEILERLVEKFMAGEIWYGYNYIPNGNTAFRKDVQDRVPAESLDYVNDAFNGILQYLELPLIKTDGYRREKLTQSMIDKYLNREIERAYIEGRIIVNKDGMLAPEKNYDIINSFVSSVMNSQENENEAIRQSKTINLAGKRKFNYRTLGFVGGYMFVSGVYRTPSGNIFIQGLMNPSTGRVKYAFSEYVGEDGRAKLDNAALVNILNENGLNLPSRQEFIGKREKENIRKSMISGLRITESPEIICLPTSDGDGTYVAGDITFNRASVRKNNILVVPYTTPDDVKAIETAKGIITTSGGLLSHAAITTREYRKPSVIVPGAALTAEYIDAAYYVQSGDIEKIGDASVKKVTEQRKNIPEGARVLLNGETGNILLFDDVDITVLDELQSAIDNADVGGLSDFFGKYKDDGKIGKLVEYAYFQITGDVRLKKMLDALFGDGTVKMPEVVKNKVKELNEGYFNEKMRIIEEALDTLEKTENINIAYGIYDKLISKLSFIKTDKENEAVKKRLLARITELDSEKKIRDKVYEYVSEVIRMAKRYANKKNLSEGDIGEMVKIQLRAAVYNYYVADTETREDLRNIKKELMKVISEIDKILGGYQSKHKTADIDDEISFFDEIYYEDIFRFGSKTTELASMYRQLKIKNNFNVSVPMGIGISANVFDIYFEITGKSGKYKELSEKFRDAVNKKDIAAAKEAAAEIKNLIGGENLEEEYAKAREELGGKIRELLKDNVKYCVRSSGVGEDGENRAYAGMGESMLNKERGKIFSHIEECWKSFYSDRSIEYMAENGKVVKPAVLIQEMVNSAKSGVVFSRDKYGRATIEVAYGLGEGVVSNTVTPDTIIADLEKGEAIDYSVAEKNLHIVAADDGTELRPVAEGVNKRVLDAKEIKYLSEIVMALESNAGYPVDVEFAFDEKGHLFILQRRAITTLENTSPASPVYVEREYNINLTTEDSPDNDKNSIVVNIAHPDKNESVSVRFKESRGNNIVLSLPSEYGDIIEKEAFIGELLERINNDDVVLKRLKKHMPAVPVKKGKIGLLPPLYYDGGAELKDPDGMRLSPKLMREMLSAA